MEGVGCCAATEAHRGRDARSPDAFYARLPALALEDGTAIREVYSEDDNLEAVFKYLVNK